MKLIVQLGTLTTSSNLYSFLRTKIDDTLLIDLDNIFFDNTTSTRYETLLENHYERNYSR